MDYIVVILLSLLTPFTLSMSDVEYNTGFGVKLSNNTSSNIFSNKLTGSSINLGDKSDSKVLKVQHFGPYGVYYDLSVEYKIYPFFDKSNFFNNMWIAPKFSYEPLMESALFTVKPDSSTKNKTIALMVTQHPSFGFNIGYDLYQFKSGGEIISPYFGFQFMKIGYHGEANYDMQEILSNSIKYTLGLAYNMDQNWTLNAEFSTVSIAAIGAEGLGQDLNLRINRVKFGVTYYLDDSIAKQKENKDDTYINILKSIDPNFKEKVINQKNKNKEEERIKKQQEEEKIKEERQQKKEKIKEEKTTKSNNRLNEKSSNNKNKRTNKKSLSLF